MNDCWGYKVEQKSHTLIARQISSPLAVISSVNAMQVQVKLLPVALGFSGLLLKAPHTHTTVLKLAAFRWTAPMRHQASPAHHAMQREFSVWKAYLYKSDDWLLFTQNLLIISTWSQRPPSILRHYQCLRPCPLTLPTFNLTRNRWAAFRHIWKPETIDFHPATLKPLRFGVSNQLLSWLKVVPVNEHRVACPEFVM